MLTLALGHHRGVIRLARLAATEELVSLDDVMGKKEDWTWMISRRLLKCKQSASVTKKSGHSDFVERDTASTLFIYTCPVSVITETPREQPRPLCIFTVLITWHCMYTACCDTMPATKSKCDKWTGLLSRSSSNHKLTAGVKKYSGHGDSFER